jgi:hypothetical protein
VDGIAVMDGEAAGTKFSGFTIRNLIRPIGGGVLEYNPDDDTLFYIPGVSAFAAGEYDFRDPTNPATARGQGTISGSAAIPSMMVQFSTKTGVFEKGETVTGSVSGATAHVIFVSKIFSLVVVNTVTGIFSTADMVAGGTSGAQGDLYAIRGGNINFARVSTLTSVSGTINGFNDEGKRASLITRKDLFATAITAKRRITMEDVTIQRFSGDALLISSSVDGGGGNANCSRIYRVRITENGGNGIRIVGGDSNQHTILDCTYVINHGYSLVDRSFLGIQMYNCHSSLNIMGHYNTGDYIGRKTVLIGNYTEGGYIVAPYQGQESSVDGGTTIIGGVRGSPVVSGLSRQATDIDTNIFRNQFIESVNGVTNFKSAGGTTLSYPLSLELAGNSGTGRGVGIRAKGPHTSGSTGPTSAEAIGVSYEYGNMRWINNGAGGISQQFGIRRNLANGNLTITITDLSGGAGAVLLADVLGGVVTRITVPVPGYNYTLNTTLSCNTPAGGSAAVLTPVVEDGRLKSVIINDGGHGYADTDINYLFEMTTSSAGAIRPVTNSVGSLGDSTHLFTRVYTNDMVIKTNTGVLKKVVVNDDNTFTISTLVLS